MRLASDAEVAEVDYSECMALVTAIIHKPSAGGRYTSSTECGYSIVGVDGRKILHLETYGSSKREIPGKVSQSLEFDQDAAAQLLAAIRHAFPTLT